jgi:hypothetical protein
MVCADVKPQYCHVRLLNRLEKNDLFTHTDTFNVNRDLKKMIECETRVAELKNRSEFSADTHRPRITKFR